MFRRVTEIMVKWFSCKTLLTLVTAFAIVGLADIVLSEQTGSGKTGKTGQNASGTAEIGSGTKKLAQTRKTQSAPKKNTEGQSQTQTGTQSTTKTKKQESSKPSGIWVPYSTAPGLRKPGTYY